MSHHTLLIGHRPSGVWYVLTAATLLIACWLSIAGMAWITLNGIWNYLYGFVWFIVPVCSYTTPC